MEITALKWSAPSRPFKKLNKKYYSTIGILVLAACLVFLAAGQFALIAVLFAVLFANYVLANVEPGIIHHEINDRGISYDGTIYLWDDLKSFGFKHKDGYTLLLVNTKAMFPGQLTLILQQIDLEEVKQVLITHLPFEERLSNPTFFEKISHRFSTMLALDK
ncbi:MAG: hypothetical protein NT141_02095 [candidate division WWE3 bacterium]|nr:hypothetical protein [candidate division WWE3 bacterium]